MTNNELEEDLGALEKIEAAAPPGTDLGAVRARIREIKQLLSIKKAHQNVLLFQHRRTETRASQPNKKAETIAHLKDRLAKARVTLLKEIEFVEAELKKVDKMAAESFEEPKTALDALIKVFKDPHFLG